MAEAVHSIEIDVPVDVFFETITDFNAYSTFLKEVQGCRLVSSDAGEHVVDYMIQVIKRMEYRLRFKEDRPNRLSWSLDHPGKVIEENQGDWLLEALDDGARTRATYTLHVKPRVFVPRAVVTRLVTITLPSLLRQFKAEAERRHSDA